MVINSLECHAKKLGIYSTDTKSYCRMQGHDLRSDLERYELTQNYSEYVREVNVWKETRKKDDTILSKKISIKV